MKNIGLVLILASILMASGCNKLDISPLNMLTDETVIGTAEGVDSYLASLYQALPIEDFQYGKTDGFQTWDGGLNNLALLENV
jgi:hypothetical protein